jgi:hypothetical protein
VESTLITDAAVVNQAQMLSVLRQFIIGFQIQCVIAYARFNQLVFATPAQSIQLVDAVLIQLVKIQKFGMFQLANANAHQFNNAHADLFGVTLLANALLIQELHVHQVSMYGRIVQFVTVFVKCNQLVCVVHSL